MAGKENELVVITKTKNLCSYIMTITEKSPKKFRFTFVSRLQNLSLEIIEDLFRANDIFVAKNEPVSISRRLEFQQKALTEIKLLSYFAMLASETGCILPKQYEQIAKQTAECQKLVAGWINSDKKRFMP